MKYRGQFSHLPLKMITKKLDYIVTGYDLTKRLNTQQTQNICITFVQRRPNVFDVGPTLYKCYTNVLCLLRKAYTLRKDNIAADVVLIVAW